MVTVMAIKSKKFRFQRKYFAFFTIIPLLLLTSIVQVECPVCGGSGHMTGTPGMENVELTHPESKEIRVSRDVCGAYIVYIYEITLPLQNNNTYPVEGWVKLVLREYQKARVMDIQYLPVRITGETAIEVTYLIGFTSGLDLELRTEVDAEVLTGEFKDESCNGTGKVPVNAWVLINGLKDNLYEVSRAENQFKHPYYIEPDIEDEMIIEEFG